MDEKIYRSREFLQALAKANRRKRQYILSLASPEQIKTLQGIAINVKRGTIPLTDMDKANIKRGRFRKTFLAISTNSVSVGKVRKALLKRGGLLSYILPTTLSFIQNHMKKTESRRPQLLNPSYDSDTEDEETPPPSYEKLFPGK